MARKLTVEVSDTIASRVEDEAARLSMDVDGVVEQALVEHFARKAVAEIQNGNPDLDEEAALELAYQELRAARAERRST